MQNKRILAATVIGLITVLGITAASFSINAFAEVNDGPGWDGLCAPGHDCFCTAGSGVFHDRTTGVNINNGCTSDNGR